MAAGSSDKKEWKQCGIKFRIQAKVQLAPGGDWNVVIKATDC